MSKTPPYPVVPSAPWDACTTQQPGPIHAIECHPGTVAAAQDLLLLGTLIVAIAIPIAQRRRERADLRERSIAFLTTLSVDFMGMSIDVPRINAIIDQLEASQPGSPEIPGALNELKVPMGENAKRAFAELHLLDQTTVKNALIALSDVQAYNDLVGQVATAARGNVAHFDQMRAEAIPLFRTQIARVYDRVTAMAKLQGISAQSPRKWLNLKC